MVHSKKGLAAFLNIMLAVTIFILALSLAGPLRNFTETARGPDQLGCILSNGSVNSTLDRYQEAACFTTDLSLPLFIWVLVGIGGAVLLAKLVLE